MLTNQQFFNFTYNVHVYLYMIIGIFRGNKGYFSEFKSNLW
jgi:hypothetical protein